MINIIVAAVYSVFENGILYDLCLYSVMFAYFILISHQSPNPRSETYIYSEVNQPSSLSKDEFSAPHSQEGNTRELHTGHDNAVYISVTGSF